MSRPLRVVTDDELEDAEREAAEEVARARSTLPDLDPAVFDCYLGGLVENIAPHTEADQIAVFVSLLTMCGVHLGQSPYIAAGDDRHPLLVWPLIVGRTSAGRKGASMSSARRLFRATDQRFMVDNVRAGLTSGEGLAQLFAEDDTPQPENENTGRRAGGLPPGDKRLLVVESEWAAVMARMKREGNSLSATLRAAWEGGDLSTMAVNARVAPTSHVGIIAHITPEEFRTKVSGSDMAGGTYNRFLPIAVARSKFLPLAQGIDEETLHQLGASLRDRLAEGADLGGVAFTANGAAAWKRLYVEFGSDHGEEGPIAQFTARAAPNCLRIAAIHAALDHASKIGPDHLAAAAALVRYSIDSARSVFTNNHVLSKLATWIADGGPDGRTRKQITVDYFAGHKKSGEISDLLDKLTAAGIATKTMRPPPEGRGGRATEIYTARSPANKAN